MWRRCDRPNRKGDSPAGESPSVIDFVSPTGCGSPGMHHSGLRHPPESTLLLPPASVARYASSSPSMPTGRQKHYRIQRWGSCSGPSCRRPRLVSAQTKATARPPSPRCSIHSILTYCSPAIDSSRLQPPCRCRPTICRRPNRASKDWRRQHCRTLEGENWWRWLAHSLMHCGSRLCPVCGSRSAPAQPVWANSF